MAIWSEHDKKMHEKLSCLKQSLLAQMTDVNMLILNIEQKYQLSERDNVIKTGRY